MEILLWLVPAVVVTAAAAVWLMWRDHRQGRALSAEQRAVALERMGEVILRPAPASRSGVRRDQSGHSEHSGPGVSASAPLDTRRSA